MSDRRRSTMGKSEHYGGTLGWQPLHSTNGGDIGRVGREEEGHVVSCHSRSQLFCY